MKERRESVCEHTGGPAEVSRVQLVKASIVCGNLLIALQQTQLLPSAENCRESLQSAEALGDTLLWISVQAAVAESERAQCLVWERGVTTCG